VYALGAIAWFLVTGQRVFSESSIPALLLAHREEEPGRPSERLGAPVDEVLEQLIVDCLRKDPDARPSDADAMLRRLMTSPLVGQWTRDHAVAWWKAPHAMGRAVVPEHGALREPPVESRS
jgi:serine/threonine-protein kinase